MSQDHVVIDFPIKGPADARVLAVLGSGVQARSHVEAMRLVRDFEEIRVWGRTPAHVERSVLLQAQRPVPQLQPTQRGVHRVVRRPMTTSTCRLVSAAATRESSRRTSTSTMRASLRAERHVYQLAWRRCRG